MEEHCGRQSHDDEIGVKRIKVIPITEADEINSTVMVGDDEKAQKGSKAVNL